jgi:hypothetical protein
MGSKGAAARTEWNEEIEDSRKDNGEPLQASRCPESRITRSRRRQGRQEFSARLLR